MRRAKNGNAVYKYQWQCSKCQKWFLSEKDMEVDHIVEIGGVTSFSGDWNETIRKMFPRPVVDHLQVLCCICHSRKTAAYMNAKVRYKRK